MNINLFHDLEPNELDLLAELVPEFANTSTIGPRFRCMNWDEEFKADIVTKKGFVVTSKPFKSKLKDKKGTIMSHGIKEKYGIHSPLFGTEWSDENAFANRYSCECHELIGKIYEGEICPKCGTKVQYVDIDLSIFGWLKINNPEFKLIQPLMYRKISTFLGSVNNILDSIINFKKDMTLDGEYKPIEGFDYKKQPFYGIGMVEFYNRFDEIMAYYLKKKKNKKELYNQIMMDKDKIFVTTIPVYSALLRQVFFTDEDFSYTKIDKYYNSIFGNINKLNEETEVNHNNLAKVNKNLYKAQINLNNAFEFIFNNLTEKEGLIRRNVLGGRINYSARTVIIPNAKLKSYQVGLPYVAFLELYRETIINLLVKLDGYDYSEAVNKWYDAYRDFDSKVYKLIEYIIKHGKPKILLNRNPK